MIEWDRSLLEKLGTSPLDVGDRFNIPNDDAAHDSNVGSGLVSSYSQCLEHRIGRVSVEPRLELGEQLAGNGRDVLDARHRQ